MARNILRRGHGVAVRSERIDEKIRSAHAAHEIVAKLNDLDDQSKAVVVDVSGTTPIALTTLRPRKNRE